MIERNAQDLDCNTDTTQVEAALYLFPVPLSDTSSLADVLPSGNSRLLKGIKHFIVENVRSARRFLKKADPSVDINTLSFAVLDEHTSPEDVAPMLAPLSEGHPIGVISEAGCPAVADPGADAVAVAQRKGFKVVPLVGPSSILMALMASGFNGQSFAFSGYLPIDSGKRSSKLREMEQRIRRERQTQIFIETPYRNNRLIEELSHTLPGNLLLCVASDITGTRQNISSQLVGPVALNNAVVVFEVVNVNNQGRAFDFDNDAMVFNQREGAQSFQRTLPQVIMGNKTVDNRIQKFYSDRQ